MRAEFFKPRFWFTWLGLGALRVIELLPFRAQRWFGAGVGFLVKRLPLAYVRIARRNLALCLPEKSSSERETLLDRHCRSLGIGLCETAMTWWSSNERVREIADVQGLAHLDAALAAGRGAIMIGGHFTTIEIATRILGTAVPLNMLYRPPKNALLAHIMCTRFAKYGKPIAHDDIRGMIRALRRNEVVWYAPDQSYRNKGAALVDFFGIPAATTTATSRLARMTGAAVLTYFPERFSSDQKYRMWIGAALENFPSEDAAEDSRRFNVLLEAHIRRVPEQYLWIHRRFKGLTTGYPEYYGKDSRHRAVGLTQAARH